VRPTRNRDVVLTSWDRRMSDLSVGPTRYRNVLLTSWDRSMSDLSVGPTRYRTVVLTSWDRGGVIASNKTHPLPHGGTDLMGPTHE
jgi:hypothetical protein